MGNKFLTLIFVLTSFLSLAVEPYDSNVDLPYLEHGWLRPENKIYLENFIAQLNPKVVVEVGTWLGLTAMMMADRLPANSVVYAVDTFEGSTEHAAISFLPVLYQQFLSNVKHRQLTHKIIPVKKASLEAAKEFKVKAQLIYIDASHDYENVYADIMAWYQHLDVGGIFCGDDWGWPGLNQAVMDAAQKLNVGLNTYGGFWYFDVKR